MSLHLPFCKITDLWSTAWKSTKQELCCTECIFSCFPGTTQHRSIAHRAEKHLGKCHCRHQTLISCYFHHCWKLDWAFLKFVLLHGPWTAVASCLARPCESHCSAVKSQTQKVDPIGQCTWACYDRHLAPLLYSAEELSSLTGKPLVSETSDLIPFETWLLCLPLIHFSFRKVFVSVVLITSVFF